MKSYVEKKISSKNLIKLNNKKMIYILIVNFKDFMQFVNLALLEDTIYSKTMFGEDLKNF
jgi:hypothetical protein